MTQTALFTGFPKTELAPWVLDTWLRDDSARRAVCVVPARFRDEAEQRLRAFAASERQRIRLLRGDPAGMDLGLSGETLRDLTAQVQIIHHCAAMSYGDANPTQAMAFHTQAAREVVEIALMCPQLERLIHWSSTRAIGSIENTVREDALVPRRRAPLTESRYQAECIVREAADHVPLTVIRTASLVGDTQTGRWPHVEGVYLIARRLLQSSPEVALPMPARRDGLLNLVPVDFAARAGCSLATHPSSAGRTFHVVDPHPLTVARAFRIFAELTGRPEPRRGLPSPVANAIVSAPLVSRVAQGPRDLLDELGRRSRCDQRNARAILEPAGLHCPGLADYAPKIVEFVRTNSAREMGPKSFAHP